MSTDHRPERRPTNTHSFFEHLENRVLLDAAMLDFRATHLEWQGSRYEVMRDSWIITLEEALGREKGLEQAQQIADGLGVEIESLRMSPSGRFAQLITPSPISENMVSVARFEKTFLYNIEPEPYTRLAQIPNDPQFPDQWALNNTGQDIPGLGEGVVGADMSAPEAWDLATGTNDGSIVVAVIDTGVQVTHPDLAANIWVNPGEIAGNGIDDDGNGFVDDINGWDFASTTSGTGEDNDPDDPETGGHGTNVAGNIGAVGNNGLGVTGINWDASIIAMKTAFDDTGGLSSFAIISSHEYLTDLRANRGINIVASNNSYGSFAPQQNDQFESPQEIAIRNFTDTGALFVAAAGNDSNDNDSFLTAYPASYDNEFIISVAATDNDDGLAGFSNWGATTVDVGAPGDLVLTTARDNGYTRTSGTSFASPFTAGVITLMAAANPTASQIQLRDTLYATVDVVPALTGRVLTDGRVNADQAVRAIFSSGPIVTGVLPGSVSGPVSEVIVSFSEPLDAGAFNPSGIELRRANGDEVFDGDDILINFTADLDGRVLTLDLTDGLLPFDDYRLTLDANVFRDADGNFLNGDNVSGTDEVYTFQIIAATGELEPNDQISEATPVPLDNDGQRRFNNVRIGDGFHRDLDVDIFRIQVQGPALITVEIEAQQLDTPSTLDAFVRLFNNSGIELANNDNFFGLDSRLQFFVSSAGSYYVGVSGFPNSNYNPAFAASGTGGQSEGLYNIFFDVDQASPEIVVREDNIPRDLPEVGTTTATLFVTDVREILDINVQVDITHSFVGDLTLSLQGPQGQIVRLVQNQGGSGDNFDDTRFDDEAATSINSAAPPFAGSFQPAESLTTFDTTSAFGIWTLIIADQAALNDGVLNSWSLEFTLQNNFFGPFEANDTLATAASLEINGAGSRTAEARVGDGAYGLRDVDMYQFEANPGSTLAASVTVTSGTLSSTLRLFDSDGAELIIDEAPSNTSSTLTFTFEFGGTYFLAVTGLGNNDYDPLFGGSGQAGNASGDYALSVNVSGGISDGPITLSGADLQIGLAADGAIGLSSGTPGSDEVAIEYRGTDFILSLQEQVIGESFFGAIHDGYIFRNAGPLAQSDLAVTIRNESDFTNRRATVEGLFRSRFAELAGPSGGLLVERSLSFGRGDSFVAFDVTLTNSTTQTMSDLAWTEGFFPLGGLNIGGLARSVNNVWETSGGRLATATIFGPDLANDLVMALAAPTPDAGITAYTSFETPNQTRDPFQIINTPEDPDDDGDVGEFDARTMAVAYDIGQLTPGESVSMRYFLLFGTDTDQIIDGADGLFDQLENDAGTGHLVDDPLDNSIPWQQLPYATYHPEGFANDRASTFVPIVNPHNTAARVAVIARYETGEIVELLEDTTIDANTRGGVTITNPNLFAASQQLVRPNTPYAIEIRSSLPVGATLSHFDFGISTGEAFTSVTSPVWTFGEGFKGENVNDFLVYLNTSAQDIKATLTIYSETTGQVFSGDDLDPISGSPMYPALNQIVEGGRRSGWDLGSLDFVPDGPFGIKLEAEGAIVAALTHFDTFIGGGFGIIGLPSLGSTVGATPEGQVGINAENEFVTILNTTDDDADITFTFFFENGSSFRLQQKVEANARSGFAVGQIPGFPAGEQLYSIAYESSQPVSVDLPSFSFGEATGSTFAAEAYSLWLFSEGFRPAAGTSITEYLRLFNPTNTTLTVEVRLNFASEDDVGATASERFLRTLAPRSVTEIDLHTLITGERAERDTFYSVEIKAPQPIVAYVGRFDDFLNGGFGTLGTPLGGIAPAFG